jgi:hypothetical protein
MTSTYIALVGDVFVRELDLSNVTLRLRDDEHVIAKLTGSTLDTLRQCLVSYNPATSFVLSSLATIEQSNPTFSEG